jgi:hypothetical protein
MLKPFMPVLLGADGSSIYVASSAVSLQVTDVCSLMPLIGLVAVFLWVRGVKLSNGLIVLTILFLLNLARVFAVAFAAANSGLTAATHVHDFAYAAFTIVTIGIIAYCVLCVSETCSSRSGG